MTSTKQTMTSAACCLALILVAHVVSAQERDIFETTPHSADIPAMTDSASSNTDNQSPPQTTTKPATDITSRADEPAKPIIAEPPPIADSAEVNAYRTAIATIESEFGAYAPQLPEQLLSLGLGLQKQGRHPEAITVFKRGTHLARISDGLYSAAQIPLVQGEIYSQMVTSQFEEADERQSYLYSVQVRSLAGSGGRTQALMQQALWQYNAYQLDIGENPFVRLLNMWDLYRLAVNEIVESQGETSSDLLPPLNGMLKAQYLISSFDAESPESRWNSDQNFNETGNSRFSAYRTQSYKKGQAVIRAIYEIKRTHSVDKGMTSIESLILMGDWKLWHGERDGAMEAYNDALRELALRDAAQKETEQFFGAPVALPDIEGLRPLPPEVAHEQANILLEFNVTERGRVTDLERLNEVDKTFSAAANRLVKVLRRTRFRPRFAEGEAIATEKVVKAYEFQQQPG